MSTILNTLIFFPETDTVAFVLFRDVSGFFDVGIPLASALSSASHLLRLSVTTVKNEITLTNASETNVPV